MSSPSSLFKNVSTCVLSAINNSLTSVHVPAHLHPSLPQNYRSIFKLPIIDKVLEKVVAKQPTAVLDKHNILDKSASGCHQFTSTKTSPLWVSSDLLMQGLKEEVLCWSCWISVLDVIRSTTVAWLRGLGRELVFLDSVKLSIFEASSLIRLWPTFKLFGLFLFLPSEEQSLIIKKFHHVPNWDIDEYSCVEPLQKNQYHCLSVTRFIGLQITNYII